MANQRRKADPGLVGATLELRGTFDPRALASAFPFVPSRAGRKGAPALDPFGNPPKDRSTWPDDWLLLPLVGATNPEHAVGSLVAALQGLPRPTRRTWFKLDHRFFNLGLSCRHGSFAADFEVSSDSLGQLAEWSIDLVLTWYWPSSEDIEMFEAGGHGSGRRPPKNPRSRVGGVRRRSP